MRELARLAVTEGVLYRFFFVYKNFSADYGIKRECVFGKNICRGRRLDVPSAYCKNRTAVLKCKKTIRNLKL